MNLAIGIDFDNTIARYDELIHDIALDRNLIGPGLEKNKKTIRDTIRKAPGGEIEWRKVQAAVYGKRMREARLMKGAGRFFHECAKRGTPIYIVSHKTEYADFDPGKINMRDEAVGWMEEQRFFDDGGFRLSRGHVFFETTRNEKIDRIIKLNLTHFIDDLEETFQESAFPPDVMKILYSKTVTGPIREPVIVAPTWDDIREYLFNARN